MDIQQFLIEKSLDVDAIISSVQASVGLGPEDVLSAVGSLAEGIGNRKSDLDLLLITSRKADPVAIIVEQCLFDIEVLSRDDLLHICSKFNHWASLPPDTSREPRILPFERRLLHRLLHAAVLFQGGDSELADALPRQPDLARLKFQIARHMSKAIQVDMAGSLDEGDYASLVFSSQELLGHAVDALTAVYQMTNPNPKWRCKLLDQLPPSWEMSLKVIPTGQKAIERYLSLHRGPKQITERATLAHAHRILAFARAIFAWVEIWTLQEDNGVRLHASTVEGKNEVPLPALKLDVDLTRERDRICLGRLNEFDASLVELSKAEAAVIPLMDGQTTIGEAEAALGSRTDDPSDQSVARRLIPRLQGAGLCVT